LLTGTASTTKLDFDQIMIARLALDPPSLSGDA
jgi:hypothetical protein